jgi:hypothetical protein
LLISLFNVLVADPTTVYNPPEGFASSGGLIYYFKTSSANFLGSGLMLLRPVKIISSVCNGDTSTFDIRLELIGIEKRWGAEGSFISTSKLSPEEGSDMKSPLPLKTLTPIYAPPPPVILRDDYLSSLFPFALDFK